MNGDDFHGHRQVTDENGAVHTLVEKLGAGGQGTVWRTSSGRRVVKLLHAGAQRERLARKLAYVKRLDLEDLHVARPLALLAPPNVGYVAQLLEDMVSLEALLPRREEDIGPALHESGGLRRRLRLLAHVGEVLAALHQRGLVYQDLSAANAFVSKPIEHHEAWLIDVDNLRHDTGERMATWTPGYAAPEIVTGRSGATAESDAWSFAVLAYQQLTTAHPMVGDLVNDGEPELEQAAMRGELPWVGDEADTRNACSTGIASSIVLSRDLKALAAKNFGAGARDPRQRPFVSTWVAALHEAADQTTLCTVCGGTSYPRTGRCDWCEWGALETPIRGIVCRWSPDRGELYTAEAMSKLAVGAAGFDIVRRHLGEPGIAGREVVMEIVPIDRGVELRPRAGELWLVEAGKAPRHVRRTPTRIALGTMRDPHQAVLLEPPERPQRGVVFVTGGPR